VKKGDNKKFMWNWCYFGTFLLALNLIVSIGKEQWHGLWGWSIALALWIAIQLWRDKNK